MQHSKKALNQFLLACLAAITGLLTGPVQGAIPWNVPFVGVTEAEVDFYNGPGQSADYARKVVVSQSGRVYLLIRGLDVGVQSSLVIKCFNPDGSLRWSDRRDVNGFEPFELLVDAQDNAFVIGEVFDNSGFPPSHDVALFKYNAEGISARENVYALDYAEPLINPFYNENIPTAAVFAPNGRLYISGYVSNKPFGDPSDVSHPYMFSVDVTGSMSLDWTSAIHLATDFSPIVEEVPVGIAVNASSEAYEVSNYGVGAKAVTLRKVDAEGENVWSDSVKIPGLQGQEHEAVAVGVDGSGNPYVVGNVTNETRDKTKMFAARFSPVNGEVTWLKTFDFGDYTEASAAKVLADGTIVIAGNVDFDWLVLCLDNAGQLRSEQRLGYGLPRNLSVDGSGNVYVVGSGSGFPAAIAVAKLNLDGLMMWYKELANTEELPNADTQTPSIAIGANGVIYVTAHRNVDESDPNQFGESYPIFDAILNKLTPLAESPLVKFTSPLSSEVVAPGAAFPNITVEASSSVGIQKVAIYDRRGTLRAVLTNAPYTVALNGPDNLQFTPLYAFAFDLLGNASVAVTSPKLGGTNSVINLESASLLVSEGESVVRVIAMRESLDGPASVEGLLSAGTATSEDFSYFGGQSRIYFHFPDGEYQAEVEVNIEGDAKAEADETFSITLENPAGAVIGTTNQTTVTILDDDSGRTNPHGELGFDSWYYRVTETAGAVTLTVLRTNGTEGTVALHYFTQPNTTIAGEDYLETQGMLLFGPGETQKTITVHALQDAESEIAESFYISLNSPSGGATLGQKSYVLVYIDNSVTPPAEPTITFDSATATMPEDRGNLLLIVRRNGASTNTATVSYTLSSGTALHSQDFGGTIAGQLTFGLQDTVKSISIPVVADNLQEGNEHFFVTLSSPENALLGSITRVRVEIIDAIGQGVTVESWKNLTFTAEELANPEISADVADPDNDGFQNIVEYALGLDPKTRDGIRHLDPTVTMQGMIPALQLSFNRPKGRNDVDFIFEAFMALGALKCGTCAQVEITDNGNGTENIRVTVTPEFLEGADSLFLNVKLQKN